MWRTSGLRHECFGIDNSTNVEALAPLLQGQAQGTTWNITWLSVSSGRRQAVPAAGSGPGTGVGSSAALGLLICSGFCGNGLTPGSFLRLQGALSVLSTSPAAPGNWFFPVLPPCMARQLTGRPAAPCSLPLGTVKEWRMSQQVFPAVPESSSLSG